MRWLLLGALLWGCGRSSLLSFTDFSVVPDLAVVDDAAVAQDAGHDLADAAMRSCVTGSLGITRASPTVLFVLDTSGSMATPFGPFGTRWTSLTHALAVALPAIDATVAMGALLFPAPGLTVENQCGVASTANLAPALHNTNALLTLMTATQPIGATPTSAAVQSAANVLLGIRSAERAPAIVLATDGAPNCNPGLNPFICLCSSTSLPGCDDALDCVDGARTVATLAMLYASGIPTYVIGIADSGSVFINTLDAMARAGGRPQQGAATFYYPADDDAQLEAGLQQIRDQVGACEYLIDAAPDQREIAISVDGMSVAFDPLNGWSWSDEANGQIQLNGAACTAAAAASNTIVTATTVCNADQ